MMTTAGHLSSLLIINNDIDLFTNLPTEPTPESTDSWNLSLMEALCSPANDSNASWCPTTESFYMDDSEADQLFEEVVRVVIPVIFGLIAFLGFVGNILVIIVVASNKQMQNTTNVLIINLAVADLVFIVVCVPFTAVRFVVSNWPFGTIFCKLYQYVIHVTAYASVYTLVLMSLDRYLAVVYPIKSMTWRVVRNAYLAIGASWLIICLCNAPILQQYEIVSFGDEYFCENPKFVEVSYYGKLFYGCFFAFAFLIPLSIVSVLYTIMIKRLLHRGVGRGTKSAETMRAKRRVTRMVVVVVLIFAICWLPVQLIFVIQSFGVYPETIPYISIKLASNCLAYMNSCVNPILYAFLSDNFRKSFRRLLGCFGKGFAPLAVEAERTSVNKGCVGPHPGPRCHFLSQDTDTCL